MSFKSFLKKIVKPSYRDETPKQKKIPEEMELESYLEQERRDRIRALVQEKRRKHNQMFNYKPSHNYNQYVKNHFQKPKKPNGGFFKHQGINKNTSLFFK